MPSNELPHLLLSYECPGNMLDSGTEEMSDLYINMGTLFQERLSVAMELHGGHRKPNFAEKHQL